jgi:hypothetical protein
MRKVLGFILFWPGVILAQNQEDILRYSQWHSIGSARFESMASSMGAVGGDAQGGAVNPAGLSILSQSEFNLSPYLQFTDFNSDHYGSSMETAQSSFRFGSASALFKLREDDNGWNNMVLGVGYSKLADYNRDVQLQGVNLESSLLDFFFNRVLDQGNNSIDGIDSLYPFGASLAWQTFLLDTFNNFFFTAIPDYGQTQIYEAEERGRMNQTMFNFSVNYEHKFYLGAGLNIRSISFVRSSDLREVVADGDTSTFLNDFTYSEFLNTSGSGINGSIGVIYKASPYLRFGLAYHTPTWYNLNDYWYAEMESNYRTGQSYFAESGDGLFEYQMTTPGKFVASVAGIFGNKGFVNVDLDYIDYREANLRFEGSKDLFADDNEQVKSQHQSTYNLRLGGEYRLSSYAIRAGFAQYGSPLAADPSLGRRIYTFGFGNRLDFFNWDLGLSYTQTKDEDFFLYSPSITNLQPSIFNTSRVRLNVGLGLRI